MDFKDVVVSRRSMRAYDDSKTVTKDQIEEIVKMASYAPSWKNSQTARYYAVLDKDKCQEFATKCLPEFNIRNSKGAAYMVIPALIQQRMKLRMNVEMAGVIMILGLTMKIFFLQLRKQDLIHLLWESGMLRL